MVATAHSLICNLVNRVALVKVIIDVRGRELTTGAITKWALKQWREHPDLALCYKKKKKKKTTLKIFLTG